MNEIIEAESRDISEEISRANIVHGEIMASKKQVAVGIYELARGLKTMRDEKLFLRLDCEDFESYCERLAKVNVSQAYKYIKVYEELGNGVLQSSGNLGIEKLFLITQLPFDEKNNALDDPSEIEGMSVRELREFVAKARQQGEQLTFLEHELEASDKELREKEQQLDELTEESDSYKRDTDDMIAKLKAAHERELANERAEAKRIIETAEANAEYKLNEERQRVAEQLEKKYKQKLEDAKAIGEKLGREKAAPSGELLEEARAKGEAAGRAAAEAQFEKQKLELEALEKAIDDAQSENEALKKSLKSSGGSKAACKVYMESLLNAYKNAEAYILGLDGDEKRECAHALYKLAAKIEDYADTLCDNLGCK